MSPLLTVTVAAVHNGIDLTDRQKAVLGIVVEEADADHTVRSLAKRLKVSKPAITRAADRLEEFEFMKRERDQTDRRSVFLRLTTGGRKHWQDAMKAMDKAAKAAA